MYKDIHIQKLDIEKIRHYFSTQPVEKVWLFGSYARGEETPESDVDLLVDFTQVISLFKHAGMIGELEQLLNVSVDLVPEDAVYPRIRPYIDQDKILIYERGA